MVRRYSATYNAEKTARTYASWSPGDLLGSSLPSDGQGSVGQTTEIMAGQQSAKAEQIAQSI